ARHSSRSARSPPPRARSTLARAARAWRADRESGRSSRAQSLGHEVDRKIGDLARRQIPVPDAVAHAEEHAHPDQRPGAQLVRLVGDLAARAGGGEVARIARGERAVMLAINVLGDELRLLDDPVELGMFAGEGDEGGEADP